MHGGTISVLTLELAGSTSWSCGEEPVLCWFACAPPGVSKTVLAGGGVPELDDPEELELELLLELLEPLWHGWIATVSLGEPAGITTWFEPGGMLVLPDWATEASEHGGTATVSALCCLGTSTVRTPGDVSAVDTGLDDDEEEELDPHAATPTVSPTAITAVIDSRAAHPLTTLIPPPWAPRLLPGDVPAPEAVKREA